MRILVCGSRTFADRSAVYMCLDGIVTGMGDDPDIIIIDGAASGADTLGYEWTQTWRLNTASLRFPADWVTHGKSAGPLRNQQMLEEGRPDMVLAFIDKPLIDSRGTADMVRRAQSAGVRTYVIQAMEAVTP